MPSYLEQQLADVEADVNRAESIQQDIFARAQNEGRELNDEEWKIFQDQTDALKALSSRQKRVNEAVSVTSEARDRAGAIYANMDTRRTTALAVPDVEYRSAGEYINDVWQSAANVGAARDRIETFHRAAAHQTTANSAGLIPTPIEGAVINFIDAARPLVTFLGPMAANGPTFYRPQVTTHTAVGKQASEKGELVSQAMAVTKVTVNMETVGGYVNLSRQLIDWSTPSGMDLVVNDLAAQYAIFTEDITGDAMVAGGTAGPTLPASPTVENIATALWTAAATVYANVKGQGRIFAAASPDVVGKLGPGFAPVNPQNSQSTGLVAANFGSGVIGTIAGIPLVMSPPLATGTLMVSSTAAVEAYEQRVGTLSVIEPSVLGVQVSYSGYFAAKVISAGAVVKITVTP